MLVSISDEQTQVLRYSTAAGCLIWPHIVFWSAQRRGGGNATERANIIADCVLGGAMAGMFALRLWPTTAIFAIGCMNALLYGGMRFLAIALPTALASMGIVLWGLSQQPHFDTELGATALSVAVIFAYIFMLGTTAYRVRQRHRQMRVALEVEEGKSQALLANVFPGAIVPRLRAGESPIADQFADVTVVFIDIVGFTPLAERLGPKRTVLVLNELFAKFDRAAARLGIEKIETTGDGYLAIGGAPGPLDDHPQAAAEFALAVVDAARSTIVDREVIHVRVGLHTGPVFAGVIGQSRFHYKVFGETVNVASRVQSECQAGRVLISETTWKRIRGIFPVEEHATVDLKGHGPMRTYWLLSEAAGVRGQGTSDSVADLKRAW